MSTHRYNVPIYSDTHALLRSVATKNRMTMTAVITELIERYAETMKSRDEYEAELAKHK